ncbi:MAG: 4-hydroxy-3-methylbut-2-enyl diphosphate reductase [Candidatus Eremiobacteraeota bacterium]|nr:4-hydroxy-3-methylbut-2-enyl diphosphate reductase [Candidatus Eremiobacteraeota bacterium]MCW5867140.1 4-hydroxy-3-methylbut-2-enyl diphosphate reductase [Candidatus Eremiobacteraeota bacterium]
MLVIQAQAMGMCFGVEEAISTAHSLNNPQEVTILGEIVHNTRVQQYLLALGFASQAEGARQELPSSPGVLVTAHGISEAYRSRLQGKVIVDTTCPLVTRLHKVARRYHDQGFRLVLVGKPGHVEVLGITEDFPDTVVLPSLESAPAGLGEKLAVLAQTTTPPDLFEAVYERVLELHPGAIVEKRDTVCRPTRQRQQAIGALLKRVQALVVVGGAHSNNTLRLCEQAEKLGLPSLRVEAPAELNSEWFRGLSLVGLSAGTSTPAEAISAVYRRLLEIGRSLRSPIPRGFTNKIFTSRAHS